MLYKAPVSLLVAVGVLILLRRVRQAKAFLSKNRRAFRFYVLENAVLHQHTKDGFIKLYKRSEPSLVKLVFSVKPLIPEKWYTTMERELYFERYEDP